MFLEVEKSFGSLGEKKKKKKKSKKPPKVT